MNAIRTTWSVLQISLLLAPATPALAIDADLLPFLNGRDQDAIVVVHDEALTSVGTGVVIRYDDVRGVAYVLTANHIVESRDGIVVFRDGRERSATIVRHSVEKDLCLLAVRRAAPPPTLEIDPHVALSPGATHLVAVGRDRAALNQHPGTFVKEFDFAQGAVDARCLDVQAVVLPGFSGGPLLAMSGGRPVIVGLVTHGTDNLATAPTADELLKFLADDVPWGAGDDTAAGVVSVPTPSLDAEQDPWTNDPWADEDYADQGMDDDLIDDDFVDDKWDGSASGLDDGLADSDEGLADIEQALADLEARLDAIAAPAAISIHRAPSAPVIQIPPMASPRCVDQRRSEGAVVQIIEGRDYGVRIVIRSH